MRFLSQRVLNDLSIVLSFPEVVNLWVCRSKIIPGKPQFVPIRRILPCDRDHGGGGQAPFLRSTRRKKKSRSGRTSRTSRKFKRAMERSARSKLSKLTPKRETAMSPFVSGSSSTSPFVGSEIRVFRRQVSWLCGHQSYVERRRNGVVLSSSGSSCSDCRMNPLVEDVQVKQFTIYEIPGGGHHM